MPTAIEKRLNAIERMLKELSGRIEQRPVVQTIRNTSREFLIIDQGNTLDSGQLGIKHLTTLLTSIPVYDANVNTTFVDGVGRARVVRDGVLSDGYYLVCNDVRSLWSASLMRDDTIAVSSIIVISGQQLYLAV